MTSVSPKANAAATIAAFPRSLSSMAVSVGGLAIFMVLASLILVSSPIGLTVHEYFYGVDGSEKLDTVMIQQNEGSVDRDGDLVVVGRKELPGSDSVVPFSSSNVNSVDSNNRLSSDGRDANSGLEVGGVDIVSAGFKSVENNESEGSGKEDMDDDKKGSVESSVGSSSEISNTVNNAITSAAGDSQSDNSDNENTDNNAEGTGESSVDSSSSDSISKDDSGISNTVSNAIKRGADDSQSETSVNKTSDSNKKGSDESNADSLPSDSISKGDPRISNTVSNPIKNIADDSQSETSGNENTDNNEKGSDKSSVDSSSSDSVSKGDLGISNTVSNGIKSSADDSGCDLYHGSWFYDPLGPSYKNNTCPVLTQMQNCQGNGRPDKDYEHWRWKPSQCDLPRFDAKKFLELMRGKTIAFIGDSVARNQMESMLCLLWQVEVPKNRGNKKMQRFYFRSTSTMVVRIWSSWLVHQTSEPLDYAPEGITKLHLDAPDEGFMEYIPTFDVIVLSSGHWFAKQSVYVLNNEIVGGQLWWPDKSRPMKINNIEAFGISVETILTSIGTHPNFTGLAIVRTYSPDHYEGGAWNTGGSCTGKVKPLEPGKLVENAFTDIMHKKQVTGFECAIKKKNNKSKLKLMDITEAFGYRHDGHPGPYRSPDPNKVTKRGPDGKPPPQDCLHWCMPGPVDTWNELVLEVIRREYEGSESLS